MRRILAMIAVAALLAPAGAGARDWGFQPRMQAQGQGQSGKKGPPPQRGPEHRREADAQPPRDDRQQGRMTQEERRELHRDLDRANREIYHQKRGR